MLKGVCVVCMAAAIRLILADGGIMDTLTYYLTTSIQAFPDVLQLVGIFVLNAVLDLVVTSGSAQEALVMHIVAPMTDALGLSRQMGVYAFQMGDGLTNLASPVSTTLNGVMALGEVGYETWLRFYAPLVGIYMVVGCLMMVVATWVGYA